MSPMLTSSVMWVLTSAQVYVSKFLITFNTSFFGGYLGQFLLTSVILICKKAQRELLSQVLVEKTFLLSNVN